VTHLSGSDTSWSLGIGYQLNHTLTLEVSYLELGEGDVIITDQSITPEQSIIVWLTYRLY